MNQEHYAQLTEGYESALDAAEDMQSCLADIQDTLSDAVADIQGDIATVSATLKACLRILHRIQAQPSA